MEILQLSEVTIGLAASVATAIINMFPRLGNSSLERAGVAIVTLVLFVFASLGFEVESITSFLTVFFNAAVYAVTNYHLIIKPLMKTTTTTPATNVEEVVVMSERY